MGMGDIRASTVLPPGVAQLTLRRGWLTERQGQRGMSLFKKAIAMVAALALSCGTLGPARAQAPGGLALIRDTEIEAIIRQFATPLWTAAGLDPDAVHIMLVNDRSLNAFVAGGQNLFLNTGLLVRAEHAGQVIGVIAHETGHMAGGHLARMPEALRNAFITSLVTTILAGAAAAASNGGNKGEGIAGAVIGGQTQGARSFFSFTRSQENSADQAGVTFLERTGQSAKGFLEFMEILQNQEFMSANRQDPYMRTHPLTEERVEFLRHQVALSKYTGVPVRPEFVAMHKRIKAKLIGFQDPLQRVMAAYPESDTSIEGRYARAIAYYRVPDLNHALSLIDGLIKDEPNNPYFHELKGQMLFENGRAADALGPYKRASELAPRAPLIRGDLAQVMLELNDPAQVKPAMAQLQEATRLEPDVPRYWRSLAVAYGRDNQIGMAAMALAEQAMLEGRRFDARGQARRAMKLLPEGSPGWLRAQDVESQAMRDIKKREDE